jgi:ribonuclease P protein component
MNDLNSVHSVRDKNVVAKPMQAQTPRTTPSRKTITPLKGAEPFSALMRTRPLAAWGQCMVHAHVKLNEDPHVTPRIELGLIVPKKAYVLAVDRNRIRRLLRAQCLLLAQDLPYSVQLLFRIKATAKKSAKAIVKTDVAATVFNRNPHSAEFAAAVQQGLNKALLTLKAMPLLEQS